MCAIYANANGINADNAYFTKAFGAMSFFMSTRMKKESIRFNFFLDNLSEGRDELTNVYSLQDLMTSHRTLSQKHFDEHKLHLFIDEEILAFEGVYRRFAKNLETTFMSIDEKEGILKEDDSRPSPMSPLFSYKPEGLFVRASAVALEVAPELKTVETIAIQTVANYTICVQKLDDRESNATFDNLIVDSGNQQKAEELKKEELVKDQVLDPIKLEEKASFI